VAVVRESILCSPWLLANSTMWMVAPRMIVGLQEHCDICQCRSEQDDSGFVEEHERANAGFLPTFVFESTRLHHAEAAANR